MHDSYNIGAQALHGGYFGQENRPVTVMFTNVGCEPDRDMTILECCKRRQPTGPKHCLSAGVWCRDDQLVKNVSATLINTLTTGSTLTHHIVLVIWQLQRNSSRTTAAVPHSFEVRCFNEMHSIKISVSSTTFTTHVGGLLRSSYYTCCVSAVYETYTAKGACTRAETPGPELLITVTKSFSTQAETPDLGITKIDATGAETPKMLTSEAIGVQTTTEIVSASMGTSKSMNVVLFGALGAAVAFFVVLSALFCVALTYQRSRKAVHMTPMR